MRVWRPPEPQVIEHPPHAVQFPLIGQLRTRHFDVSPSPSAPDAVRHSLPPRIGDGLLHKRVRVPLLHVVLQSVQLPQLPSTGGAGTGKGVGGVGDSVGGFVGGSVGDGVGVIVLKLHPASLQGALLDAVSLNNAQKSAAHAGSAQQVLRQSRYS